MGSIGTSKVIGTGNRPFEGYSSEQLQATYSQYMGAGNIEGANEITAELANRNTIAQSGKTNIESASRGRVKVDNQVYESENYQLQKVRYQSFTRGARGSVRLTTKIGYEILDSRGNKVERDNRGYFISNYRYKTQKEAKAMIEALEKQRRK